MRTIMLSSAAVIALTLAACGDDTQKTTPPSQTPPTSGPPPSHPPPAYGVAPADGTATTSSPAQRTDVDADNSARNKRDDGTTLTPLDQGTSDEDIAITQAVRKAVVAHKGLSINAQNVKIIAKDGTVTLRGPVASVAERDAIVEMAKQVPAVHTVVNKLEVASR